MRSPDAETTTDQLLITSFFCLETFTRHLLMAIVPLDLLGHLGSLQHVTLFYAVVAIFGLGNSILVPFLLQRLGIRLIIAAAGVFITTAAVLLASESLIGTAFGLFVRVLGTACIEIPLVAYIMDRIPRSRLSTFEPKRIFFQGLCMGIAPWLGFQLRDHISVGTPFVLSAIGGVIILGLALWALPLTAPESNSATVIRRPADTVRRFVEQPRLRLAWTLALIRASFWIIFSIYAPIFSVTCGWSPAAAAAVLSLGNASLLFVVVWGKLVRSLGVRRVLTIGYALAAACLVLTAIAGLWAPQFAPLLLLASAFGASIVDGPGNIAFLRATRSRERSSMTGIYMTYRDVSQFAPIATFSLILVVAPLSLAFVVFAGAMFGAARLSLLIHPRIR
jgi:MFS family permease